MNSSHLWEANPCFCLFPVSLQAGLSQVGPHAAATSALAFAERLFSQDIAHSDAERGLGLEDVMERSHCLYASAKNKKIEGV